MTNNTADKTQDLQPTSSREIKVSEHITLFFTNPGSETSLETAIIDRINAQPSGTYMDLCFYGLNRDKLLTAIENAIYRGVHVRFIGNKSGNGNLSDKNGDYYEGYHRIAVALDECFPVMASRANASDFSIFNDFKLINNSSIMHNKFAIFTDSLDQKYLLTGTTNMTDTGLTKNNNNSLIFENNDIANIYQKQFESYLGIIDSQDINTVSSVNIDGIDIDILFAPNILDGMTAMDHLVELTKKADDSIHFMIFSYPYMGLNEAMLNLAINHKVDIKGIFDQSQLNNGAEEYYAQRGIPVRIDGNTHQVGGHGGKLHHKTMIIDSSQNDAVVVTGSFNWSNNANVNNNENMIFIHSPKVASFYEEEWQRCWDEGTAVPTVNPRGDDALSGDIIINEVLWMGSNFSENGTVGYKDEFIELLNMTDRRIDLAGWTLKGSAMSGKPMLFPVGTCIEAGGYLVVSHYYNSGDPTENQSAIDLRHSCKVIDELAITNNSTYQLILEDQDFSVIDTVGDGTTPWSHWAGYNSKLLKRSMIRTTPNANGMLQSSWTECNAQINIQSSERSYLYATPGAENQSSEMIFDSLQ